MPRNVWIAAVLVIGMGATALLVSQPHPSDLAASSSPPTVVKPVPSPDVRVRHEYITITPIEREPRRPSPRLSTVSLSASAKGAPSPAGRARQPQPTERALLSKVGRAVAGDGRFRPEPFPRLR